MKGSLKKSWELTSIRTGSVKGNDMVANLDAGNPFADRFDLISQNQIRSMG